MLVLTVSGSAILTGRSAPGMGKQAPPWLSVVVPAFNERKLLAGSLESIRRAVAANELTDDQWELIVCDNASTDETAEIAGAAGARVVYESRRQIARARNSGAAIATGQWLLFVDADTCPEPGLLRQTLVAMGDSGICGGGAQVASTGAGTGAHLTIQFWNLISRTFRLAAGGYLFCRRQDFIALGGFCEELFAAEEIDFSKRLAVRGRQCRRRFVILKGVEFNTSLRKLELYRPSEILWMLLRGLLQPRRMLRDKKLLNMWYDGRR